MSRPVARAAFILALWTFFGSLFAVETFIQSRVQNGTLTLGRSLLWHLAWAFSWALFTPIVLWLRRRFPLDRRRWRFSVAVHVPISLFMALLGGVCFVLVGQLLGRYPAGAGFLVDRSLLVFVTWLHLDPFLYWLIIGITYTAQYYRESRERQLRAAQLETQLTQARLQALEMQLHPHFLFNALNTIAQLVRTGKNAQAVRVVSGLGELLRRALDSAGVHLVPLKQELEFVRRYLEIEEIRFGDRLRIEMCIEPDTEDAQVPYLILQPLVENAIQHGLARRAAPGHLRIDAERRGGRLHLSVRDDGAGLPRSFQPDTSNGVGLTTTAERLQRLYGDDHAMRIMNREEGGVSAVIDIPFRVATDEWQREA